jgi:hypothetical protein
VSPFYVAGAAATYGQAINTKGFVTGYYAVSGTIDGFIRDTKGGITGFSCPNANATQPFAMNATGVIAGSCVDAVGHHAFLRTP